MARALAAVAAAALLAGCGASSGSGSNGTPSGSSGAQAPVVSGSSAGVEAQAGSGSTEGPSGSAAAGTVSQAGTGHFSNSSTGTISHGSVSTFSVSHTQLTHSSQTSQYMTPAQLRKAQQQANKSASKPPVSNSSPTKSAPTGSSTPAQHTTAPRTKVLVVTRYKVYTVFRTRTITKVVTETVPPKIPVGAFLPSKHPVLGQKSFTITGSNVACVVAQTGVRCAIKKRSWTAPRAPRSCRSTWGDTIALASHGLPAFACGGSSPLRTTSKVIPSGWDDQVGEYTCQVRSFGINCFNNTSRSGFMIGRTGYTLY